MLSKHQTGVHLLSEPKNVEDIEAITPSQVREVIGLLRNMFQYVVVDTEPGYGDRNIAAMDSADMVLLVGIMNLLSIKNLQKSLDVFGRLGYSSEKVRLVVNRRSKKDIISPQDAEKTLNTKVFRQIPNNYAEVTASINRGMPLAALTPNSEISRSFKDLSTAIQAQLAESSVKFA